MAAEVAKPFNDDDLLTDKISKKDLVTFLQENASSQFLLSHKLAGAVKNVVKTKTKDQLVTAYKALFNDKAFKMPGDELPKTPPKSPEKLKPDDVGHITHKAKKLEVKEPEVVKYTKRILKMGDRSSYPMKGDTVECFYTGRLDSGKVFDTNVDDSKKAKKSHPLKFKVGLGKVIRGWDEALLTMTVGEQAEIVIQPEWAYGKKGLEGKIPPNSVLTFDVELVSVAN